MRTVFVKVVKNGSLYNVFTKEWTRFS